jgi:predicted dehydrogenase
LASAISRQPALSLEAVVDRREGALSRAALEKLGVDATVHRFREATELFESLAIDLLCITTNGPSHCALTLAALEAGIGRVMVEKPMACSVAECREMIAAARERGARLLVDQSRRYAPAYRWLRRKIASGDWGDLRCLWIQRPGIGLGCLGSHSFDLVRFLSGRDVANVTAWVDPPRNPNPRGERFVDPGGLLVLDLGMGQRAIVAQIEDGAGPMAVEIDLTGARIRLDEKAADLEIIERDLSVKPGPGRPPIFERTSPPGDLRARPEMAQMLDDLLIDLMSDGPPECLAEHGAAAVEILVAAHLSHESGNLPVALPLTAPEDLDRWLPIT